MQNYKNNLSERLLIFAGDIIKLVIKINNLMEVKNMLTLVADEIMEKGMEEERIEITKAMIKEKAELSFIIKVAWLKKQEIEKLIEQTK